MRPLTTGFLGIVHAMSDAENGKLELECLRLASDLRQLAKETLAPDLKAYCLWMAKACSDKVYAPADKGIKTYKGPVH